jgi:apolipoprotein N-acyltransferase
MKMPARLRNSLLSPVNALLAAVSAILLIFSFPDFELWPLAWVALVPLLAAVEREKDSAVKGFLVGWVFGVVFFTGSCWWLTFAPITYAGIPAPITYFFLFCAASAVGIFPGIFGASLSFVLKKTGAAGILSAPFLWTAAEFLRMSLTGNNWNALGYAHAFQPAFLTSAAYGGVYLTGFLIALVNAAAAFPLISRIKRAKSSKLFAAALAAAAFGALLGPPLLNFMRPPETRSETPPAALVVAVQPNVPMSGLTYDKYQRLLARHIELAETALKERAAGYEGPTTIIFPESPMIFQYGRDEELRDFLRGFAARNNASVLFNSAEKTPSGDRILNSAVMIDERGEKVGQYDKIHLVPFGEFIPFPEPLASRMPAFVGNFEFGDEYDLLPFGAARGGVMICFESHFGTLSREYARRGADVLIEMTNDGYLGPTPILRQHLANSVFRAAETSRPLVRVTNVGVTALITARGEVREAAGVYAEATRVWTLEKSDGRQTFYVKYGDWFAWLCSLVTLALLFGSYLRAGDER